MDEAAQHEINVGDYSDVLFDCIDMHRPSTALYLIDQGADPEVYARVSARVLCNKCRLQYLITFKLNPLLNFCNFKCVYCNVKLLTCEMCYPCSIDERYINDVTIVSCVDSTRLVTRMTLTV